MLWTVNSVHLDLMNKCTTKINFFFSLGLSEVIHLYFNKSFYFHMKRWTAIQSDMTEIVSVS